MSTPANASVHTPLAAAAAAFAALSLDSGNAPAASSAAAPVASTAPASAPAAAPGLPEIEQISHGVLAVVRHGNSWRIGIIHIEKPNGKIVYGFPKGKPEPGEAPLETAARELREEALCIPVYWVHHARVATGLPNSYTFEARDDADGVLKRIKKTVYYHLAIVRRGTEADGIAVNKKFVPIQSTHERIVDFKFYSFDEAKKLIGAPLLHVMLDEVLAMLT